MRQKNAYVKKWTISSCALPLTLPAVMALAEDCAAKDAYASRPAKHARTLAEQGVAACVPRPSIEPPPPLPGVRPAPGPSLAVPAQGPCPEGFVPQPIERRSPKGRSLRELDPLTSVTTGTSAGPRYYCSGAYQFTGQIE